MSEENLQSGFSSGSRTPLLRMPNWDGRELAQAKDLSTERTGTSFVAPLVFFVVLYREENVDGKQLV